MHDILSLRRRQPIFFIVLLATFLTGHQLISAPARVVSDVRSPHGLRAAAVQAMGTCQELLSNGDLEASGGWAFGPTPAPGALVTTPVHAGSFAIRLGITTGTNRLAYSTAYQTVSLPADAQQLVLTYWERAGATGDSGDYREILALRPDLTVLRTFERQSGAGNDTWTQRSFDLTDLRGQVIVLYFNAFNNGSGATLVNYLDDIALQSCDNSATATPTASPTATETPIPPTPTPTATLVVTPTTPTPTVTATPVPSSILVRVGAVAVAEGQTTVAAPLDLIGATAETAVGVLSVDVQYDASVLKAIACPVSDSFDLLLCNLATPGVVQLAGVAASGVRSDLKVADLAFELLSPVKLNTQLTVQLAALADIEGVALSATTQNGQILAACLPGSASCPAAFDLYLPLVSGGTQ